MGVGWGEEKARILLDRKGKPIRKVHDWGNAGQQIKGGKMKGRGGIIYKI